MVVAPNTFAAGFIVKKEFEYVLEVIPMAQCYRAQQCSVEGQESICKFIHAGNKRVRVFISTEHNMQPIACLTFK